MLDFTTDLETMTEDLVILGKSNYALSILLDILKLKEYQGTVHVVTNLPEDQNSSADFPYEITGLNLREYSHQELKKKEYYRYLLGSIGKGRQQIYHFFKDKFGIDFPDYEILHHPNSVIASSVEIGTGSHIGPLSVISPYAVIGNACVVNRNASVGHHTILEDFACINPGANIAGICHLGKNVMIGAGATVIDQVKIGENTIIGAGSVVTKNIPANVIAYGSPARVIREIE